MNMYFAGVTNEQFSIWHKSFKADNTKIIFLSNNDFFEKLQRESSSANSKYTWMYLAPWREISQTSNDTVASSLKIWMTRQHSAKLCISSSSVNTSVVNIGSEDFKDFWLRVNSTSAQRKSSINEEDSIMLGMMKALAPIFYNTFNSLENNSLGKLSEPNENNLKVEQLALSRLIASSNCYKRQSIFDKIQYDLEFRIAELEKILILERDAKLKAEAGQRRLKEEHNTLSSRLISDNTLLSSRINFAESQLSELSHVAKLYSSVVAEARQALQLAKESGLGKVAYGRG